MRSRKFQIIVAILVAPVAVLGIVAGLVLSDETMLLSSLLLTALYLFYLVKLRQRLKKEDPDAGKPSNRLPDRR